MPPESNTDNIAIIGGGWAGISTAVHLARAGQPVTLFEAADQLGGRARMVMFDDTPVDNGQHIALGAYRNLLELLAIIDIDEERVLSRLPLSLHVNGAQGLVTLNTPKLPAPFHLLIAFLKAQGLSASDKFKTIINWTRLIGQTAKEGMTVSELLQQSGQSTKVCHYLWEPLCIAALNTPPAQSSARLFQRVLRDSFMRRRVDSDILLPRYDLGRVLPIPAADWLQQHGATVRTGQRVSALVTKDNRVTGIQAGDEMYSANQVIIATNPWSCATLIKPVQALQTITNNIEQLEYQPIATVYLKYKKPVLLNPTMQGYADTTMQWLFDRRITGHSKILAAVISADGEHAAMDKDALAAHIVNEVKSHTHIKDDPASFLVIREKRATFAATPTAEQLRPANHTPLAGCWIAGDYTDTGYPATLEGAIISGKSCATQILKGTTP